MMLLPAACARDNPAFNSQVGGSGDGGGVDTTKGDDDDDDDDDAGLDAGNDDDDDDDDDDDGDDDDDDADDSPGPGSSDGGLEEETGDAAGCRERSVDLAAYRPCFGSGCPESGECFMDGSEPPVLYGISVCTPECEQDCDCPGVPALGVEAVCEGGGCVLECGGDAACPSGMVCHLGRCAWHDAYGPCGGDQCVSERCVQNGPNGVCAALDCWADGELPSELCPPPRNGDAEPFCFEPQEPAKFNGEGWCVVTCGPGTECPEGMSCVGNLCMHPM